MPINKDMIILSDGESDEEVTNSKSKMGSLQSIPSVSSPTDVKKSASDADDITVVSEVTKFKKHSRGAVIGGQKFHDMSLHSSQIKRRRKPDGSSGVKYSTTMRSPGSSSRPLFFNSSVVRRRLFQLEESIRLEERRRYVEFIKNMIGVTMIMTSELIKQQFSNSLKLIPQKFPAWTPPSKPMPQSCPVVECIDLTHDDSADDCHVVEPTPIARTAESAISKDLEIEEVPPNIDEDVIVVEDESETPAFSEKTHVQKYQEESVKKCSEQCEVLSIEDEENEDVYILIEDEDSETDEKNEPKNNLEDQILNQMVLYDTSVCKMTPEKIDDLEESQPDITRKMQVLVHKSFTDNSNNVLVEGFGLQIRPKDIHTLKGDEWLNDQVINFYVCLLMERGKLSNYPSVYCFNTFFYVKLISSGHAALKRWTRKVDIFSYDILVVPVHLKVHWCLACVNFIEKRIECYDSLGESDKECGMTLFKYLEDEHLDKRKEILNVSGWEIVNMKDIPEQLNGSDCGVFLCTYAEYICRLAKLTFSQRDMPYFRVKMAYEILTKKLLL